jgi:hypothetical protein
MAAGTWTLTNTARTNLINGTFDIDSDSFKVALVTNAGNVSATSTTWAAVTGEVGTTNTGYTTGGIAVTLVLAGTTSVTVSFSSNPTWTAGSAGLTAKWAVLYEVSGNVLCFVTLDSGGADVTATSGNTLTIDSDGTPSPVFTLA